MKEEQTNQSDIDTDKEQWHSPVIEKLFFMKTEGGIIGNFESSSAGSPS